MRLTLLLFAATLSAAPLPPEARWDLRRPVQAIAASASGFSYVSISERGSTLVLTNGASVDVSPVREQPWRALPRPDGSFWIVSRGPYEPNQLYFPAVIPSAIVPDPAAQTSIRGNGQTGPAYFVFDLYSATGARLQSGRILGDLTGTGSPLAATNELLVVRTTDNRLRFGAFDGGEFKAVSQVELTRQAQGPGPLNAIPLATAAGRLILVDRGSGNLLFIDPGTRTGSVVKAAKPRPIRAAAVSGDDIYLLSGSTVVRLDARGRELARYECDAGRPDLIAVDGHRLYLADRRGHVALFRVQ